MAAAAAAAVSPFKFGSCVYFRLEQKSRGENKQGRENVFFVVDF